VTDEEVRETAGRARQLSPRELDRFHECVLPYLDVAHNLAHYLLRDAHEAEDAVQDSFLRAIRHFDDFRGVDGRAWLLRIVRNICLTRLRGRQSSSENVEFDEEIHTADGKTPGPDVELDRKAQAQSVRAGLDRLPVEFREVIVLRELEGMSYKEP
jgi:RNA polymerase sigma-70 factor (ECF subfamily)